MSKRLEIAGTGKVWIVKKCIECPLLDSDACCVIDNKHRPKFCEECENCPLPDATEAPADVWPDDENHRLGPNGERLIAEREYCSCSGCFYDGKKGVCRDVECYEKIWKLTGDRT